MKGFLKKSLSMILTATMVFTSADLSILAAAPDAAIEEYADEADVVIEEYAAEPDALADDQAEELYAADSDTVTTEYAKEAGEVTDEYSEVTDAVVSDADGQEVKFEYLTPQWDEDIYKVIYARTPFTGNYTSLSKAPRSSGGDIYIGSGDAGRNEWYVADQDLTTDKSIIVKGKASLVVLNGVTVKVNGINVSTDIIDKSGFGSGREPNVLDIYGQEGHEGKIITTGKDYCAGIGGADEHPGGIINIYGSTIIATGGTKAAGIGGGREGDGGNIYIWGGKITASGGKYAAGIGGGIGGEDCKGYAGEDVKIYGGYITAFGGYCAAGLGGGQESGARLNIFNTDGLEAHGGDYGAGIGGGEHGSATIFINGGIINAFGGKKCPGIGNGHYGTHGNMIIKGGYITSQGSEYAAGIGGSEKGSFETIRIMPERDCDIRAIGGEGGAGIGGGADHSGNDSRHSSIYIDGGKITAIGGKGGAGIGSGDGGYSLENFVMTGGTVYAEGGAGGAGVGGGLGVKVECPIEISGGTLNASTKYYEKKNLIFADDTGYAAAIGAGYNEDFKSGSNSRIVFKGGHVKAWVENSSAKCRVIGAGFTKGDPMGIHGSVTIADNMAVKVSASGYVPAKDRLAEATKLVDFAEIEECKHGQNYQCTYNESDPLKHTKTCNSCKASDGVESVYHDQVSTTWVWAEDCSSVTAVFHCSECDHDYTFPASDITIAEPVVKPAEGGKPEEREYTATLNYAGKTFTNKKVITVEAAPQPEDEGLKVFNEYKTTKKAAADALVQDDDSIEVRRLVSVAKSDIDNIGYVASKSLDENKAAVDAVISRLTEEVNTERNKGADLKTFDNYKNEKISALGELVSDGDSFECTLLVTNAQIVIVALDYDEAKTLEQNKAAVDEIITKLNADLTKQRFTAYKNEKKDAARALGKASDSTAIKTLISTALSDIDAYAYDESKTLDQNKAAVDAIVTKLSEDIAAQKNPGVDERNLEEFNAYKNTQKAVADGFATETDTAETTKKISDAKDAIDALAYDSAKSLEDNKVEVRKIIENLTDALGKQKEDAFNLYKNVLVKEAENIAKDPDLSDPAKRIVNNMIRAIKAKNYESDKTFNENIVALDSIIQEYFEAFNLQSYKDQFDEYKTEQIKEADSYAKVKSDEGEKAIIDKAKTDISTLAYDESKTFEENEGKVDELIGKLKKDIDDYWTNAERNYTVTFDTGAGTTIAPATVKSGDKVAKPADPTRSDNIAFVTWMLGGSEYDFNTPVTRNITLVAKWATKMYEVSFDSDGGTGVVTQFIEENGTAKMPKAPVKDGYTFDGWYNGTDKFSFSTPIKENTVLKAQWKTKSYTVTFDSAGGSKVESQTVEYGTKATKPEDPTRKNTEFKNWQLNGVDFDFDTPVTADITLTANWDVEKFTVTFDPAGGSEVSAKVVEKETSVAEPTAPVREGYTFAGWFDQDKKFDFKTKITADITLTAHWEKAKCTVTFDAAGGSAVESKTVEYGTVVEQPKTEREGYKFEYWMLGDTEYDFTQPVQKDMTLKAKWDAVSYKVTFMLNGELYSTAMIKYEQRVKFPTITPAAGKVITGWCTDKEMTEYYSSLSRETDDLTLYAEEKDIADSTMITNGEAVKGDLTSEIAGLKDKETLVTLSADTTADKLKFPAAGTVTYLAVDGTGKEILFNGAANIKPNQTLTISNVTIKAQKNGKPQNITLTAAANEIMELDDVTFNGKNTTINATKSELVLGKVSGTGNLTIKGSKNQKLSVEDEVIATTISGYGTVVVDGTLIVTKSLTVDSLYLEEGGTLIVGKGASVNIKKGIVGDGEIVLMEGAKPITLSGSASGNIMLNKGSAPVSEGEAFSYADFSDGDQLFKSKLTNLDKVFDFMGSVPVIRDGEYDYGLYNKSGKVFIRAKSLVLDGVEYYDWNDMVTAINKAKASGKEYKLELLGDVDFKSAIKLPGKKKYAGLIIEGNDHTITFKGKTVALTGNLTLENVKVQSVSGAWNFKDNGFKLQKEGAELVNAN